MRFALMASLVTTLAAFEAVGAQTPLAPVVFLDATLVGAQPTGDFGLNVDEGWACRWIRCDPMQGLPRVLAIL